MSARSSGSRSWPTLWVASEDRDVLHINPVSSRPRSARVPKGLVHAVNRDSSADALTTICGRSLDRLVQFPHYNFEATGTRTSRLVTVCATCQGPRSAREESVQSAVRLQRPT
jgi:hypothetical protein